MSLVVSSFAAAVLLLLALASPAAAFNITRILGEFPDFSTFNGLLSQTKLADEINRRQTITVLAVNNGGMGGITSLPSDVQRKVLAVHVVLDYYDTEKLGSMKNRSAVLTTLFQSTGQAANRMGFINYTRRATDGVMMFGSAEPGAPLMSQMVKSVMSRPYNISVLEVSSAIVPPSIGSGDNSKAHAPAPAHAKTPAPAPTPSKSKKPEKEGAPVPAPAPSDDSIADAPADGPDADGPAPADAPADDDDDKSSDDTGDAAGRVVARLGLGIGALLMILLSL
ncbi:fasciclin-like arabinogalactan protein 3 [Hordeum vulgare subsp. vulgare]|uniref:FAS1 domain-containing protein n=1 Tax=Hordeum vulgare subsp. vulgare TaxID=112509 RepID=A0A8I6WDT5_HORVV|nr:fasciclin-like arabinogalactan protein 3 [Hordeum vulgare subsp. vulgare]